MANLSQLKREKMLAFLEKLKEQHTDDDSLIALGEIEKELKSRKKKFVLMKMGHIIFCLRATIFTAFTYSKRHIKARLT